jgi:2-iminobutanoate/2-iminopropanoate deaminase
MRGAGDGRRREKFSQRKATIMIKREFMQPKDMWARVENGNLLYVPVVTVHGADHAHVYLAGQMAREPTGEIVGIGDMRAQMRKTCENIGKGLAYAGATFDDVVRSTTYVTDIEEYYKCSDERFKFFTNNRPASVLIQVSRLGHRDAIIEIEVEAIIEPERLRTHK